jgi:hypothetical protein
MLKCCVVFSGLFILICLVILFVMTSIAVPTTAVWSDMVFPLLYILLGPSAVDAVAFPQFTFIFVLEYSGGSVASTRLLSLSASDFLCSWSPENFKTPAQFCSVSQMPSTMFWGHLCRIRQKFSCTRTFPNITWAQCRLCAISAVLDSLSQSHNIVADLELFVCQSGASHLIS